MKQQTNFRVFLVGVPPNDVAEIDELLCEACRDLIDVASISELTRTPSFSDGKNVVLTWVGTDDASMAELKRLQSTAPVIALVAQGDVKATSIAFKSGARDALEWPNSREDLLPAVKALGDKLMDQPGQKRPASLDRLTLRERSVLDLLVEGRSNKLIGQELGISERTVEVHRANIMRKMHVNSFAALIRLALTSNAA